MISYFYHSLAQSPTHESNDSEKYASDPERIPSDVPQDYESSNEDDVDEEERYEESPSRTLNARGFSPMSEDVDMTGAPEPSTNDIDTIELNNVSYHCHLNSEISTDLNVQNLNTNVVPSPQVLASLPTVEISQTGREVEEIIEESGRGRRKRALRQIGDLNGCLCGKVVNPGVDSRKIECRQPGCETQWVRSTVYMLREK